MKRIITLNIIILLILIYVDSAWGDNQAMPLVFKNITIETMGDLRYDPNQNIITVANHVRLTIDDTIIEADSLTYYENQNQIVAAGNVRIIKNAISITANQLVLDTSTGWLEVSGGAQYISPIETYSSETIRYNLNQKIGEVGPLQGVVKGVPKDFYLTGKGARLNEGVTVISSAGLTRSPWRNHHDYVFDAQRMVIKGEDIYMEKVVLKILGLPVLYLPRMDLQGESVPKINLTASQGEEFELNQQVEKVEKSAAPEEKTNTGSQAEEAGQSQQNETTVDSAVLEKKYKKAHVSPRFQLRINPVDKPSVITVGRIYSWDYCSNEVDLNYDSRGIFSISDVYQIDWAEYNFTIDGKTDLVSRPQQELGIAFTKKAWKTEYGYWQTGLVTRWLYSKHNDQPYQGIYGGYRLDYQLNPDLNLSYLYLDDLSGSTQEWEHLEEDFLIINNYRLGSNFIYSLNVPLSPHYFMVNKGYYSVENDSWTSQVLLFVREVGSLRMGFGWDFAKNIIDLTFKLNL